MPNTSQYKSVSVSKDTYEKLLLMADFEKPKILTRFWKLADTSHRHNDDILRPLWLLQTELMKEKS